MWDMPPDTTHNAHTQVFCFVLRRAYLRAKKTKRLGSGRYALGVLDGNGRVRVWGGHGELMLHQHL